MTRPQHLPRMRILAVLPGIAVQFLPLASPAHTWEVTVDHLGDAPNIQAGIDSSSQGDTVLVQPGVYLENLDFLGKEIVVRSAGGPGVTTIDGSSTKNSVVMFKGNETRNAALEGFTITGGRGSITPGWEFRSGGGIYCVNGSPTIRGNRILANTIVDEYRGSGAGIRVGTGFMDVSPDPLIEDNVFELNVSPGNGGGIAVVQASATIRDNMFLENRSGTDGAAIWLYTYSRCVVTDNRFVENVAGDHGGAIEASLGTFTIERNLCLRNQAQGLDGPDENGAGGAISAREMNGVITYNTLVGNSGSDRSPCSGGGILLSYGTQAPTLVVARNIIVQNSGCGIACYMTEHHPLDVRENLLWGNSPSDLSSGGVGFCPQIDLQENIFADPLFCDADAYNFSVAENSPAAGWGAFAEAGCGPVSVVRSTWGGLKARYKRQDQKRPR